MRAYILRRILFMIPTIFGIMLVTFVVIQFAPGGPIDHVIAKISGTHAGTGSHISGSGGDFSAGGSVTGGDQTDVNSKTGTQ